MKKIFSILLVFILALTLVSCKDDSKAELAKLDAAEETLKGVLADPTNILVNFNLPVTLADGVKATWTSSNEAVAKIGAESSGTVIVNVIRPDFGSADAKVDLNATLSVVAEKSGKEVTKDVKLTITVKAETKAKLTINSIRDMLNIKDTEYAPTNDNDKISATFNNVTVFAAGSDSVFIYDGTGVTQVYGGASETMKVGKVYNVTGLLTWYFGLWEITKSTAEEVVGATPQYPEQKTVTSIDAFISELKADEQHHPAAGNASNGNMEPIYAKVTAKVYTLPNDTSNYNTYLIDTSKDVVTLGAVNSEGSNLPSTPATGLMAYYPTNDFTYLKSFSGFEVTLDVVVHTYRSNNYAFAFYYVGGNNGIELGEVTDEQAVELAISAQSFNDYYFDAKTLTLPADHQQGATLTWTVDKPEILNVETGVLTLPDIVEEVKLTVTATKGDESDEKIFTLKVGKDLNLSTIAQLNAGTNKVAYRIEGIVTSFGPFNSFTVEDATGATAFRIAGSNAADKTLTFKVGDKISAIVVRNTFNGLIQGELFGGKEAMDKVTVTEGPHAIPELDVKDLNEEDLSKLVDFQSFLVNLDNALVTKHAVDTYDNVTMTLMRKDGQTINFKWDARTVVANNTLADLKVGDVVNVVGAPLSWNNGALIMYDALTQVVKVTTVSDELKLEFDKLVIKENYSFGTEGDLALPNKGDAFDTTITYSFKDAQDENNALLNLDTMKVLSIPNDEVVIVLNATLTSGDETKVVEVSVKLGKTFKVVMTYASGQGSGNLTDGNNASTVGLDKSVFNLLAIKNTPGQNVGVNNAGQIRIYSDRNSGDGNAIKLEIADGYVITSLKFVFTNASNKSTSALLKLGSEETTLTEEDLGTTKLYEDLDINVFELKNTHKGGTANGQIWLVSLEITYKLV